jgi:CRP/FNR family transcriptional regulator
MVTKFPELMERMKRISHFQKLSEGDLLTILQAGRFRKYSPKSTIFHEGDPCFGLCVLLRGEVHLYKLGPEGQENIISVITPVIMFNEVASIDGQPNPVSAVAYKNSLIWHADYESFQFGLQKFPGLGLGLLPILARRNRKLIAKYADLSFRPVRERMAILLLELSDFGHTSIDRREHSIQQMAAHIATVPVVISRTLGEFKEEGIIDCTRKSIVVSHPDELADLALLSLYNPEE